mmetsp:Transcript_15148/g.24753  ORF Transcript_15148/g.24753 Transcript_15148/m.24753 type:complete len:81 (-) Transcript_15148:149-391(-)
MIVNRMKMWSGGLNIEKCVIIIDYGVILYTRSPGRLSFYYIWPEAFFFLNALFELWRLLLMVVLLFLFVTHRQLNNKVVV